ncbi:DUF6297 family protein [Micromonospora sp. NPDC023888]|uniref:DUF6297 family protein n=1 Tax=Micromonospora sp. NPDC023888 TaxID=3155607 RepID=UPI0033C0E24B
MVRVRHGQRAGGIVGGNHRDHLLGCAVGWFDPPGDGASPGGTRRGCSSDPRGEHRHLACFPAGTSTAAAPAAVWRLDRLPQRQLAAGSTWGAIAGAGLVTVDPGIASRAAEERRWAARAPRGGGLPRIAGPRAVVGHDLVTARRSPGQFLVAAAALLVPALVGVLTGWGVVLAAGWLLSGLAALAPFTVNARRDRDLPALRRLLNLPGPVLLGTRSVLPAVLAVAWGVGAGLLLAARTPGADGWAWPVLGAAAGPGLAAGAVRAARRGAVRHELPPIVTPMGVLPTGPLHWAATGWDIAVLCTLPALTALVTGAPTAMILPQAIVSLVGLVAFVLVAGRGDGGR